MKAVLGCGNWSNNGGKSGARFGKSYNDMIVMKIIVDKEFVEFRKFASSYV